MIILTPVESLNRTLRRVVVGIMVGVALSAGVFHVAIKATPELVDHRLERMCRWPVVEGAMTVVTVLEGKLICWRWQ